MNLTTRVAVAVIMGSIILSAGGGQIRLYDIKSGELTYSIRGSGDIMGVKMEESGRKRVIFDNYGTKNLTEETKVKRENVMGQKNITETHTMTYMNGNTLYHVDFNRKMITAMENRGMTAMNAMGQGGNINRISLDMMKQMGGRKTGTDRVLGYTCDVWELMGVKQCIYKGIPLKIEADMMGMKATEIATNARFDISLSNDDFKLPDFPLYDVMGNRLDKKSIEAMEKNSANPISKHTNTQRASHPATTTKEAMMNAMLPQLKAEIRSQGKALQFAKECFGKASTLKDAKRCEESMDKMTGETDEDIEGITEWNSQIKKETMKQINQGLKTVQCAERAKNMQEIQRCMPKY